MISLGLEPSHRGGSGARRHINPRKIAVHVGYAGCVTFCALLAPAYFLHASLSKAETEYRGGGVEVAREVRDRTVVRTILGGDWATWDSRPTAAGLASRAIWMSLAGLGLSLVALGILRATGALAMAVLTGVGYGFLSFLTAMLPIRTIQASSGDGVVLTALWLVVYGIVFFAVAFARYDGED